MNTNDYKTITKSYTLRIKNDLFERVRISAVENHRSIAKEIEYILDKTLNK